jgi:hypothetical protein
MLVRFCAAHIRLVRVALIRQCDDQKKAIKKIQIVRAKEMGELKILTDLLLSTDIRREVWVFCSTCFV